MNEIEVLSIMLSTLHRTLVEIREIKLGLVDERPSYNQAICRLNTLQDYIIKALHRIEGN